LLEFELWWPSAPENERILFSETVDMIAMISLSQPPRDKPSLQVKDKVMASIKERPRKLPARESTSRSAVPGYTFLSDFEGEWRQLPSKGTRIKELSYSKAAGTATFILEMDPGSRLLAHHHRGAEEAFVLHGDLQMRGRSLRAGDYMRAEPGTRHEDLYSEQGCRALIITALENYPRLSIRAFDGLHRAWSKCKNVLAGSRG
jgi:hypothetical protein